MPNIELIGLLCQLLPLKLGRTELILRLVISCVVVFLKLFGGLFDEYFFDFEVEF